MKSSVRIKIASLCALIVCFSFGSVGAHIPKAMTTSFIGVNVSVYGSVIGMSLESEGLLVMGNGEVETVQGHVITTQRSDIRKGDVVVELGAKKISCVEDVETALGRHQGKWLDIKLKRREKTVKTVIEPAMDKHSGLYKLGLWVKDHVSGIGTLTFSTEDGRFGALGHGVTGCEASGDDALAVSGGELYPCEVLGVKKGVRGAAGSILGTFSYHSIPLAKVESNDKYGLDGVVLKKTIEQFDTMPFGGRAKVHLGSAQIVNNFSGTRECYSVEIEKIARQDKPQEKSLTLRITDERLIERTGGIVQGMSGSPIIQNGYLIGAVTHVLNGDPTRGFGVFADWML